MFAKFHVEGFVASCEEKVGKKSGKPYGFLTVGCGTVAHEFFVDLTDVHSGKFKPQAMVRVTGTIGKNGYNAQLEAEKIEVLK